MLYIAFLTWKPGLTREQRQAALARHGRYRLPDGCEPVAEYWPSGPVAVVAVFEADDTAATAQLRRDWQDAFDVTVLPVVSAGEELRMGAPRKAKDRVVERLSSAVAACRSALAAS
jgi:hypothetical protein